MADRFRNGSLPGAVRGAILILACVVAAYLIANAADLVRAGSLLRGRDFRHTAMFAAVLILIGGLWWSLARRHGWAEMLGSMLLVEVLLALLIVVFSGSASLDAFFFDWFQGLSLHVALPWLIAIAVGAILGRGRPG